MKHAVPDTRTIESATAFVINSRAAVRGDASAMRQLALALEFGHGVRRDPAAALRWWRRAAAAGDTRAIARLAPIDRQAARLVAECLA